MDYFVYNLHTDYSVCNSPRCLPVIVFCFAANVSWREWGWL